METERKAKLVPEAVAMLLSIPALLWTAYVAKTLWWWFVVPLGAPAIGMAPAYGLSVLVLLLTTHAIDWKNLETTSSLSKVIRSVLFSTLGLVAGYIAHRLMVM